MLQSPVHLATQRLELTAHFLRAFGDPPWPIIAGGRERSFTVKALPDLGKWITQQQSANRNVFAPLPRIGGNLWHLAVRAPFEVRPAEFRFPPSLIIVADGYWLLWRSGEPMKARLAQILSERLAKDTGGVSAIDEPVPLPGTILFKVVGAQLQGRFPVQLLPPLATSYRIIDGELVDVLVDVLAAAVESIFVRADRVEAQPPRWLWENVIPLGDFTVIMGEPGVGKSQIALDIVARVTAGGIFPGGGKAPIGSAIVCETEDDVPSVVIPRLQAAGADMRKVLVHGAAFDLSQGPEALEAEARRLGDLKVLVLSPLRMFFGETEAMRQVDTRARIEPLLRWASARNVAVIGVAHKEAGKKGRTSEDMAGPKAFAQRARAVYTAAIDDEDPERDVKRKRRVLVTAKANNAPDTMRHTYRIEGARAGEIETSRVAWG